MSATAAAPTNPQHPTSAQRSTGAPRSTGDSFATGVLVMLLLNIVQRVAGLLRGLGFCHFLSDVELGQWALLNSFFVIGVPIAVLGLPGSFGRFVEYFRIREQLGHYFRSVLWVSLSGLALVCTLILLNPEQFSWFLFRRSSPPSLIAWCVITLISAAAFSFVNELVGALREVRAVSLMQFVQSFVFAIVGLSILSVKPSWTMLLPSFTIACLLGLVPGLVILLSDYRCEFRLAPGVSSNAAGTLWSRILPYAVALWVMNLLSNLFEVSDRYMLLHLVEGGEQIGQALVGQYHCGRILPNLLTSVAIMLGGILVPFLSADWEAGRGDRIAARMRQVLQCLAIGFMALSTAAMCVSPLLFHYGFGGRYQPAEEILPISLLQATWASLFIVAQSYLLCIERGKRLAALLIVGLAANFGLNWLLIPQMGLFGAVVATSSANLFTLLLLLWQMSRSGCKLDNGTLALCLAPLSIAAGPVAAALVLAGIVVVVGRTQWLLSDADRQQIDALLLPKLRRLGMHLQSLWP